MFKPTLVEQTPRASAEAGEAGWMRDEAVAELLVGSDSPAVAAAAVIVACAPAPTAVRVSDTSVNAPDPAMEPRLNVICVDVTVSGAGNAVW